MAGGMEGTVVEVGFRSTRLMTIDTSIISIPNGQMANMSLTNLGLRDARLFNIMIGVTYDTPPERLEQFIAGLRELILENEKIRHDMYYVHLRELADSSLNIMFRCYITVPTFAEEAVVKEELLFQIIRLAEKLGVNFAFPSTSVYLEKTSQGNG